MAEMSFEAALAELEQVVARLEGGQVPLEESIALYARGAELRAHCEERLKAAEARVAEIAQGPDGDGADAGRSTFPDAPWTPDALQFHAVLSQHATRAEAALEGLLPAGDTTLGAAMRHAVLGGGKRMRAFLALEGAAMFRVPPAQALRTAAAVECIHAYSLVHDDLPCMDDDDLRRGQPTVHVKWDEATAVLAGDALQALAFEVLAAPQGGIEPRQQVRLMLRLAQAAGAHGMVGGQAIDIAAEKAPAPLDLAAISDLQALKTGALFVWAAESGAILGRQDAEPLQPLCGGLRARLPDPRRHPRRRGRPGGGGQAAAQGRGARQGDLRVAARARAARRRKRVTWWRTRVTVCRPTARRPGTCGWRRSSFSDAAADGRGGQEHGRSADRRPRISTASSCRPT